MARVIAIAILTLLATLSWSRAGSSVQQCLTEEQGEALGQILKAGEYASAYRALLPPAKSGCAEEQFTLGMLMYHGKYDFTSDTKKHEQEEGYNWLLKAASKGIDRAARYLGAIRKNGWGGFAKNRKIADCWERASPGVGSMDVEITEQCLVLERHAPLW